MNKKYIFLLASLFSTTLEAAEDTKDKIKNESSSHQVTLPIPIPQTPPVDVDRWSNWSYEDSSIITAESSSDSEDDDQHSYTEYQNEHKGDN